ncbi:flagellinolysin [Metabacillus fastidiosus]|uniref:flagellinolysin n=1 Tax=Metabacillus fastidiosus TaxID=1458 RepID=UPI002E218461|nr:flagellinolysin [Metabacillus fastidiosus]MED4454432.1 flagellinolysin [Metabacillus fastidiosus]
MRINHNISALNTHLQLSLNNNHVSKSMEKLSSGLRINRAGDDAAGLAISEKMRGQIRELAQEQKNMQDGVSMIQTAEGGMEEIHELLQRGRELSVQAKNDTLADSDRKSIQVEINQIVKEVDRIANSTEFNTLNLLNVTSSDDNLEQKKAVEALQKYWLKNSETLIATHYGLQAGNDDAPLDIQFIQNSGDGRVAWVQGSYSVAGTDGRYFNQKLVLDMSDFSPVVMPNGGGSWISNDRIIAHEMVHAVMGRTTNMRDLPTWFKEGTAEFLAGADERLSIDSNNGADFATLKNEIDSWGSTSADYSAAYAAVKYLDAQLAGGIKSLFDEIKISALGGNEKTLDQALTDLLGVNEAGFLANFKANATLANSNIDLTDTDTGAIGGGDDYSTVPDVLNADLPNPLAAFVEKWPTFSADTSEPLRVGQFIYARMSDVTSKSLGIDNVNILNQSDDNISIFDGAIQYVSSERARLGALQNRLEKAMAVSAISEENLVSAESRIRDVDMAREVMSHTQSSILTQAAQAMLAQANQQPQAILQLLR